MSAIPLVARRVFARLGDQLPEQAQHFVLVYGIEDATVPPVERAWPGPGAGVPGGENGTIIRQGYTEHGTFGVVTVSEAPGRGPVPGAPRFEAGRGQRSSNAVPACSGALQMVS